MQSGTTDVLPETMANLRALGLRFGPGAAACAAVFVVVCFGAVLRVRDPGPCLASAILVSLLLSPHTYHYDLSLVAVAAGLTGTRAARVLLLIPWPFLYGGDGLLPMVAVLLTALGLEARLAWTARSWRDRAPSPAAVEASGD